MSERPTAPPERLVLLGASNLARGLRTALALALPRMGRPAQVLVAGGHGRSYGIDSTYLFARTLPGIEGCGLWRALQEGGGAPTGAVLTDVGNDLLYGVPPERIAGWIERCLDRLEASGARIALAGLPLPNLRRLKPWQVELWRRLFFPGRAAAAASLVEGAEDVAQRLAEIARARSLPTVAPERAWYRADPIHVARSRMELAWSALLEPVLAGAPPPARPAPRIPRAGLVPERRRILGIQAGRAQPCRVLEDGTSISLY